MFTFGQSIKTIVVDADSFPDPILHEIAALRLPLSLVLFSIHPETLSAFASFPIVLLARPLQFLTPEQLHEGIVSVEGTFSTTVVLSADQSTLEGIQRIPIGSILYSPSLEVVYSHYGRIADYVITSIGDLKPISEGTHGGFISEALSNYVPAIKQANYITSVLQGGDGLSLRLVSGGRYFARGDTRAFIDPFSERILKNKEESPDRAIFERAFSFLMKFAVGEPVDFITRVPPKPDKPFDRFSAIIATICESDGKADLSDKLVISGELKSQKGLSSTERMDNVKGKYKFLEDATGKHAVLFDDVVTTGSTALSCARAILAMGARKVTLVTLGINQFSNSWLERSLALPSCPKCGSPLHVRINKQRRNVFYGCGGYPKCMEAMSDVEWKSKMGDLIDHYQLHQDEDLW